MKNHLHCVQTLQMDYKILSSSRKRSNKGFYVCLNTKPVANDAPTTDLMYYKTCCLVAKKEADKTNETFDENDYINTLSDIETVHFIKNYMADPSRKLEL